jgi:hypothetical protein
MISATVKVESVTAREVRKVVLDNADTSSHLRTDQAHMYRAIGGRFASHEAVDIPPKNGFAAMLIPTPSRVISRSSSAA